MSTVLSSIESTDCRSFCGGMYSVIFFGAGKVGICVKFVVLGTVSGCVNASVGSSVVVVVGGGDAVVVVVVGFRVVDGVIDDSIVCFAVAVGSDGADISSAVGISILLVGDEVVWCTDGDSLVIVV
jgi:hypothetical protein